MSWVRPWEVDQTGRSRRSDDVGVERDGAGKRKERKRGGLGSLPCVFPLGRRGGLRPARQVRGLFAGLERLLPTSGNPMSLATEGTALLLRRIVG